MLKLTKFSPPFGGVSKFHYTSHVMKRSIPQVYHEQPPSGFVNGFKSGRK